MGSGSHDHLKARSAYTSPTRECDVVMKGGITSGVLYPLAVCELATNYTLRSIGGTSAGAIAAAAAASAEYGRRSTRPGSGFEGLANLPDWLAEDDHLIDLFQPSEATRPLHRLLMRAVRREPKLGLAAAATRMALFSKRWWMPLLAVLPAILILAGLLVAGTVSVLWSVAVVIAVLVGVVGLVVGATVAVVLTGGEVLAGDLYGIVGGSQAAGGKQSLSDWLADELDTLAGLEPGRHPLTFRDLWDGPEDGSPINLEMQTTNVTEGRPYRLPGDLGTSFAFDEGEFRRIFPGRVVDYLKQLAGDERVGDDLIPLPAAADLPVVVATRMSLSFPILISAVPLHSVDRSMQEGSTVVYEHCWFSDGGITSNFPVSFFDSLLPGRPTFGINLRGFHPKHSQSADECENVWMPRSNRSGILEWWSRWPADRGIKSVGKFLRAIIDTMQNWVDNQQTRVPGYRDRIIHISHNEDEGGMNLAMPPKTLERLSERGRCAGARLVEYYTHPPQTPDDVPEGEEARVVSWENHRWIRLRTAMALVSDTVAEMAEGYTDDYAADLGGGVGDAPSYKFNNLDQQALAKAFMEGISDPPEDPRVTLSTGLVALAGEIATVEQRGPNVPLGSGAPGPPPILRIAPGSRAAAYGSEERNGS